MTDNVRDVFESRVRQTAQCRGVGDVIDDAVKCPPMSVKPALNTRHADARSFHTGLEQRLRHALTPGIFHRAKLRYPVVPISWSEMTSGFRLSVGRITAAFEAGQEAAIGPGAARLFERQVQIPSIDAQWHKNTIEARLRRAIAHPLTPIALSDGIIVASMSTDAATDFNQADNGASTLKPILLRRAWCRGNAACRSSKRAPV